MKSTKQTAKKTRKIAGALVALGLTIGGTVATVASSSSPASARGGWGMGVPPNSSSNGQ